MKPDTVTPLILLIGWKNVIYFIPSLFKSWYSIRRHPKCQCRQTHKSVTPSLAMGTTLKLEEIDSLRTARHSLGIDLVFFYPRPFDWQQSFGLVIWAAGYWREIYKCMSSGCQQEASKIYRKKAVVCNPSAFVLPLYRARWTYQSKVHLRFDILAFNRFVIALNFQLSNTIPETNATIRIAFIGISTSLDFDILQGLVHY